VIAPAANLRMLRQQPETLCDGIDKAVGALYAAALVRDVRPDVVKLGFGFR
jgi:hypothetical protein